VASGLLPGALEIMDRLAIQAAEAAVQANYPKGAEAVLIVELEGEAGQVAEEDKRLQVLIQESGAYEVRVAQDEADRQRIWRGRKSAFSAVGRLSPDFIVQDGVVPRSRLGETLKEIQRLSEQYGIRVANVFHAGDGNLHPLILYDGREAGALERAEKLAGEILRLCIRLGGSITGEHGVGLEKRDYLPQMYAEADVDVMWKLRCAMDPKQIANRGKMFPSGASGEPAARFTGLHPLERDGIISRE
jgi:glycolate oxidase